MNVRAQPEKRKLLVRNLKLLARGLLTPPERLTRLRPSFLSVSGPKNAPAIAMTLVGLAGLWQLQDSSVNPHLQKRPSL